MKYRKKPVVIEAFKWTADKEQEDDPEWIIEAIKNGTVYFQNGGTEDIKMIIKTMERKHIARRGYYIIKGIKGELYGCEPSIFEATYEKVDD
jgi:hypothetical protein